MLPSMPNLSLASSDQTAQTAGTHSNVAISPGGINFGEIMQSYSQPMEAGGPAVYPPSRLFDQLHNTTPAARINAASLLTGDTQQTNKTAWLLPVGGLIIAVVVLFT